MRIVISDLDGTIALVDHRRHHVEGKKKDWRAFFAACVDDTPNEAVVDTLRVLDAAGYVVVIVSARSKEVYQESVDWLRKHDIPFDQFYMLREAGNCESDVVLKKAFLDSFKHKESIFCVYDDRDSVVQMWREQGLPCFQVAPGDF